MRQINVSSAEGSRDCWRRSKERQRLKARYEIHSRVAASSADDSSTTIETSSNTNNPGNVDVSLLLKWIIKGDRSKFSITFLNSNVKELNQPIALSRWFVRSAQRSYVLQQLPLEDRSMVENILELHDSLTLMEMAILWKKSRLVGNMLVAGLLPTVSGRTSEPTSAFYSHQPVDLGNTVLRRFLAGVPPCLSTFLVMSVVSARMASSLDKASAAVCPYCGDASCRLIRWKDCGHTSCERCIWMSILDRIDDTTLDGNASILCCSLCCQHESYQTSQHEQVIPSLEDREARASASLALFQQLPVNGQVLKAQTAKKRTKESLDWLASNWTDAVAGIVGKTQVVRQEKFWAAIAKGSIPHVRGCLDHGVDIYQTNEYGQTALYVAAWQGDAEVVDLLLRYGCKPNQVSHGGSTPLSVATTARHDSVVKLLVQYGAHSMGDPPYWMKLMVDASSPVQSLNSRFEVLIPKESEHAGAGSYVCDGILPDSTLDALYHLWRELPVAIENVKLKSVPTSKRSYFCDAERSFVTTLEYALRMIAPEVIVFPHMRYLNYDEAGTSLPPHVDLSRVWQGRRSTHSFLLYLLDCDAGGETVLLESLKGSSVIAKVHPQKGRVLLFPHACPHEGLEVKRVPKLLIRGEVWLP